MILVGMTNKLVIVGITWTRPCFDEGFRIDWVWLWEISDFFN